MPDEDEGQNRPTDQGESALNVETSHEGTGNPFASLEVAFASDRPPVRYDFAMHGRESYITLKPFGAKERGQFEAAGRVVKVDTTARTVSEAVVHNTLNLQEEVLLLGTVFDYVLWKLNDAGQPTRVVGRERGALKTETERRLDFQGLDPAFQRVLVVECLKVNHLDPNAYGYGG